LNILRALLFVLIAAKYRYICFGDVQLNIPKAHT